MIILEEKAVLYLQTIAEVLVANNATYLIEEIAKRDSKLAQVLDILVIEENEKADDVEIEL